MSNPNVTAELPIDKITPSRTNPRKDFDEVALGQLAHSISERGVIEPIIVRKRGDGYEIVAGERRWRATKKTALTTIPAIVMDLDDDAAVEIQAIENLQRADLHPMEEARGYHTLIKVGKLPVREAVKEIARRLSKPEQHVYDTLNLVNLTTELEKQFREKLFTRDHAVILARLSHPEQKKVAAAGLWDIERVSVYDRDKQRVIFPHHEKAEQHGKTMTARELQAYVDEHIRAVPTHQHLAQLFPETAKALAEASPDRPPVMITFDFMLKPDARGKERTYTQRSWKRAQGKNGDKTCDYARVGVVAAGPGRFESFLVCVDKKKCGRHWGEEQRASKKRAEGSGANESEKKRREEEARQIEKEQRERGRYMKALPEILKEVAAFVEKAPVKPGSALAEIVDEQVRHCNPKLADLIGEPKDAEGMIRFWAFCSLVSHANYPFALEHFSKRVRSWGIDVKAIMDRVAPVEKPKATAVEKVKKALAKGGAR